MKYAPFGIVVVVLVQSLCHWALSDRVYDTERRLSTLSADYRIHANSTPDGEELKDRVVYEVKAGTYTRINVLADGIKKAEDRISKLENQVLPTYEPRPEGVKICSGKGCVPQ